MADDDVDELADKIEFCAYNITLSFLDHAANIGIPKTREMVLELLAKVKHRMGN